MKIYNGTNSLLNLPLANGRRLVIDPKSVSVDFLPTAKMLQMLVSAYSRNDIAFIPAGPNDLTVGATVSTLPAYIANSLEEAVNRFIAVPSDKVVPTPSAAVDKKKKAAVEESSEAK